jgi:hypothetical protein
MAYRKPGQMGRHACLPLLHPRPGGVDAVAMTGGAALRGLVGITERAERGRGTGGSGGKWLMVSRGVRSSGRGTFRQQVPLASGRARAR